MFLKFTGEYHRGARTFLTVYSSFNLFDLQQLQSLMPHPRIRQHAAPFSDPSALEPWFTQVYSAVVWCQERCILQTCPWVSVTAYWQHFEENKKADIT